MQALREHDGRERVQQQHREQRRIALPVDRRLPHLRGVEADLRAGIGERRVPGVVQRQVALGMELQAPGAAVSGTPGPRSARWSRDARHPGGSVNSSRCHRYTGSAAPASENSGSRTPSPTGLMSSQPYSPCGCSRTVPPRARARICPPRQQPSTGTSPATHCCVRMRSCASHGIASSSQAWPRPPSVIRPLIWPASMPSRPPVVASTTRCGNAAPIEHARDPAGPREHRVVLDHQDRLHRPEP